MIFTTDTKRQVKRYISYNYPPPPPASSSDTDRLIIPLVVRESEGEWAPFIQIMILSR